MIRRGWIVMGAMIAVLGAPFLTPAALAGGGSGSDNSAAQQYVEAVPTATGGGPSGGSSGGASGGSSAGKASATKSRPVAPAVRKSIAREGGSDTAALRRVATSPALGAPPVPTKAPPTGPSRAAEGPGSEPGSQSAFGAALSVDHGIPVAFVLLALIALAAAYVVGRRGHPSRSSA